MKRQQSLWSTLMPVRTKCTSSAMTRTTTSRRNWGVPAEAVTQAKRDELQQLRQMGTFTMVSTDHPTNHKEAVVVGTKWVIVNKGDHLNPRVKARLCAQEFAVRPDAELFAGTPGLTGVKCILSHFASSRSGMALAVADVKGAFLYGRLERNVFIKLPREMTGGRPLLGKLNKSLYGLRDAPKIWRQTLDASCFVMG